MTELIRQRGERDCYLCCLAMATSRSYNSIAAALSNEELQEMNHEGSYGALLDKLRTVCGLKEGTDFRSILWATIGERSGTAGARPGVMRALLWGRRAIIQVPSLNYENQMHVIYWDGHQLFDPSNKKTYDVWDEVPMNNYITIFNEASK
jgi:hypothetical protein